MTALLQKLDGVPFRGKLALLLAAPILAMVVYAALDLREPLALLDEASSTRNTVQELARFSRGAADLVDSAQRERGLTEGFLASNGTMFGPELADQRAQTDRRIAAFLASLPRSELSSDWGTGLAPLRATLDERTRVREEVDALAANGNAFTYYSDLNALVLLLIQQAARSGRARSGLLRADCLHRYSAGAGKRGPGTWQAQRRLRLGLACTRRLCRRPRLRL